MLQRLPVFSSFFLTHTDPDSSGLTVPYPHVSSWFTPFASPLEWASSTIRFLQPLPLTTLQGPLLILLCPHAHHLPHSFLMLPHFCRCRQPPGFDFHTTRFPVPLSLQKELSARPGILSSLTPPKPCLYGPLKPSAPGLHHQQIPSSQGPEALCPLMAPLCIPVL